MVTCDEVEVFIESDESRSMRRCEPVTHFRRLATGNWQLATGDWRLATDDWRPTRGDKMGRGA